MIFFGAKKYMEERMPTTQLDTREKESTLYSITEVYFNDSPGFGFGIGQISRQTQLATGELTSDKESEGISYIINSPDAFVAVDKSDDGCSDGRIAAYAEQLQADGSIEYAEVLLHRAKIFGGGVMMTVAGKIGSGVIAPTAFAQFDNSINFLQAKHTKFGAHDDEHATGDNCGCGAIDRYPDNLRSTQLFKTEIKNCLESLFGEDFNDNVYEEVSENFRQSLFAIDDQTPYSGKEVRTAIGNTGAVIKRLTGTHQEDFVVINFIKDTTLNQAGLMHATDGTVQAFCVDAWRLQEYAQLIADGDAEQEQKALYGMLAYTLATSGTLTDGSQRVLVRK